MIVERDPPLTREDLNDTQIHMLKQCDIPGLLTLETEECDGRVSLRYSFSGTRMLSEAMRTSTWSMADMMGALCRLAEVLEECRLYLLDADRIRLLDEFIFVGDEWYDLKFTYLPIDMPTLHRADDLERLIIRWMMRVKEPDGQALQNILRLVGSPGFMPIVLSRYARQYLAGSPGGEAAADRGHSPVRPLPELHVMEPKPATTKPSRSWDFLNPVSGDLHPVSEMWGDAPNALPKSFPSSKMRANEPDTGSDVMDIGRWRIVIGCVSVFVVALSWRFIYLSQPNQQKLLACLCLSLIVCSLVIFLWNGIPDRLRFTNRRPELVQPSGPEIEKSFKFAQAEEEREVQQQGAIPRFPSPHLPSTIASRDSLTDPFMLDVNKDPAYIADTTWMSASNDQTAYLNSKQTSNIEIFYLIWKTKDSGIRIPLQGNSFVIGRSAEAAQHIDESIGISRAHVEFLKVSDQWKVKDLGSRNGSRLNDKPMAPYELYSLQVGDCLTIANSQYRFQQEE
ncbi:DUF6382 domain-containing protein [Cohnella herbarum]|uniref:FHA domain-containing protein n=1 Tax=Cohnella herbarum TaxID=2728023 RepID=A0A7Z2VQ51_9BACL|nr:DUF6382 domain-containing protein [Cohnella herbarum]QJD87408.1 FHA domain-containing protein [Cohnella herbarum]